MANRKMNIGGRGYEFVKSKNDAKDINICCKRGSNIFAKPADWLVYVITFGAMD